MKRKIPDCRSRDRTERSGKGESCFWQKKIGHENGQGENTGERGQLLDECQRGSGRDGYNTGGKRLTLKYCSSGTGKTEEKVVESQRLIKTTKPMLLHEKD